MVWPIAAAIAASAAASMYGQSQANKASDKAASEADALRQQALGELSGMSPIEIEALQYNPQLLEYLSGATPIEYSQPGSMEAETIQVDPETRAMQMQVLADMTERSEEGLSAQDKYNFMRNRRQVETSARGREEAIRESLKARGMSGTGMEAAMRMMASQGASERLSESEALQASANASARQQALMNQANLAGNVRGQDVGIAQSNADILNDFGWKNSEQLLKQSRSIKKM